MGPKVRQTIYYVGTVITAVIGCALLWGGLSADAAHSIVNVLGGVLTLLGAGAPAVAARTVGKQMKNGKFDENPADRVINGINDLIANAETAKSDVERVKDAVTEAIGDVPVLGPLAQQALNSVKL